MELISKQLRKLDIFGQEIRLQADSQSAFRTKIGAIMTLILFTILAYSSTINIYKLPITLLYLNCYIINCILEMNKGKNAVLNSKDAVINPEDVNNNTTILQGYTFHSTELLFAAGLVDTMGQPIPNDNNRIFSITFYFCQKQYGENNCVNIPSIICGNRTSNISLLDVPQKYLNITYCIDENYLNNNPEIRIQGSPKLENFTQFGGLWKNYYFRLQYKDVKIALLVQIVPQLKRSIDIQLIKCIVFMSIIIFNLINQKHIQIDNITNSNLFYSYSFHYFNKEQEVSPYEKAQSIDSTPIFNKVGKYIRIYFKYSQSFIEYNPFYFFPQLKQIEGIEYENTAIDSTLNYEDNNNIALFELNLDAKKKIHFITYQTLMDVAAKIGGLFTILRVIFDVVLFPFQRISYRLYLANCLSKQQRNFINNDKNKGQDELNLYKLITSSVSRYRNIVFQQLQLYLSQSMLIDKFLDITEILIIVLLVQFEVIYLSNVLIQNFFQINTSNYRSSQDRIRISFCQESRKKFIILLFTIQYFLINHNPIKITKQMEDLQGSIKRYDILNSRNKNIVSELDEELVFLMGKRIYLINLFNNQIPN